MALAAHLCVPHEPHVRPGHSVSQQLLWLIVRLLTGWEGYRPTSVGAAIAVNDIRCRELETTQCKERFSVAALTREIDIQLTSSPSRFTSTKFRSYLTLCLFSTVDAVQHSWSLHFKSAWPPQRTSCLLCKQGQWCLPDHFKFSFTSKTSWFRRGSVYKYQNGSAEPASLSAFCNL